MKNILIAGIAGLLIGSVITGFVLFKLSPGMMLMETASPYDFSTTVQKLETAVAEQGWRMPAVHDLQATLLKSGKNVRSVKVFELCHPDHAEKILKQSEERIVSTMMPCRVAVYEKADGKVYISRMNSALMANAMGGIVKEVMAKAFAENEHMIESTIK
ncbi:MAG: DUF302 domain-containing protein [Bacteroidales bacterium]|nr:DUF302 domain-containing protein [Bacteroidales bacterium]